MFQKLFGNSKETYLAECTILKELQVPFHIIYYSVNFDNL